MRSTATPSATFMHGHTSLRGRNNLFTRAAVVALLLAPIFPVYWVWVFSLPAESLDIALRSNLETLDVMDGLFVVIGCMEVHLYLSLRRAVADQLDSATLGWCLLITAALVGMFHATAMLDVVVAAAGGNLSVATKTAVVDFGLLLSVVLHGLSALAALVTSLVMLLGNSNPPRLLLVFASLWALASLAQLSVVFAFVNLGLFPMALLVLAIYFFKEPQTVEVV